jgi:uncharacterized protein (TIGR02284 family)
MSTNNRKAVAALNKLISTCKDGASGYHSAGKDVKTQILKELFGSYAQQRAQFVSELLAEVHRLDDEEARRGSVGGSVHRGWMKVKSTVARRHAHAILAECERGERAAARHYEAALKEKLPPQTRALLEKQYIKVKEAHQRVHTLKVIGALRTLIATCIDGEKGYRAAAKDVREQALKEFFQTQMKQRGEFAAELTQEFHRLGGDREKMGTWTGKLHRGWMNLKAILKSRDAGLVLKECERGERTALRYYEKALQAGMPVETRALLEKQHASLKEARARIGDLRAARVTA